MANKKLAGTLLTIAVGQATQLLFLWICERITYTTHQFLFCLVAGIITMLMLVVGAFIAMLCTITDIEGEHVETIGMLPHKTYAEFKDELDESDEEDGTEDVIPSIFKAKETVNG